MSDKYQCHVTIENALDRKLKTAHSSLEWGEFSTAPVDVPQMSQKIAFVATGKPWLPGGTEGTVEYAVEGVADAKLKIYFDVPMTPGTTNRLTADFLGRGYKASVHGLNPNGSVAAVIVKVEEA